MISQVNSQIIDLQVITHSELLQPRLVKPFYGHSFMCAIIYNIFRNLDSLLDFFVLSIYYVFKTL